LTDAEGTGNGPGKPTPEHKGREKEHTIKQAGVQAPKTVYTHILTYWFHKN